MTLDQALELFRQEKPSRRGSSRKVIRDLGPHPDTQAAIRLLEGRYGPYVTDGTTNASLPKEMDGDSLTLDSAVELLRAREGTKPRARSRKGPARNGGAGRRR